MENRKYSFIKLLGLFLLLTLFLTSCKSDVQENGLPKKIRIGTIRIANDKTVAHELGYFKEAFSKKGIEVEMMCYRFCRNGLY